MFLYLIGVFFSTTVLAISNASGGMEVTYPSLETLRSGVKILKLRSFGRDIELRLEPAGDVIADDFIIMDGNGKIQKSEMKNLKRKLFRNKEKDAALYINEEGPLEIKGMLTSKLRIEPYKSEDIVRSGIKAHRITETLLQKTRFNEAVLALNLKNSFNDNEARNFTEDQCVEIEYLFITDHTVTRRFINSEKLETHIANIFVKVQNMMDTLNLNIKVRLFAVKSFTKETEPSFIEESLITGTDILHSDYIMGNLSGYNCENKQDELVKRADIIMLLTRRRLGNIDSDGTAFGNYLGLAHFGEACHSCGKCGVILHVNDSMKIAYTLAHETAHLIGSPHDGAGEKNSLPGIPGATECTGNGKFIMENYFGNNERNFSTCSRENIKYFLNKKSAECIIVDCNNTL